MAPPFLRLDALSSWVKRVGELTAAYREGRAQRFTKMARRRLWQRRAEGFSDLYAKADGAWPGMPRGRAASENDRHALRRAARKPSTSRARDAASCTNTVRAVASGCCACLAERPVPQPNAAYFAAHGAFASTKLFVVACSMCPAEAADGARNS